MTKLYNCDNAELMAKLPNESIDVICIDPPYLYLKNQKLERAFDEPKFFRECYRLLTKKGFIIMFGRGVSFYRWNTMIAEMVVDTNTGEIGYLQKDFYGKIISPTHHKSVNTAFKEEIIWDKAHCTSPLMNLSRVHETISIFTKKAGTINKVKIPYLEIKGHDIDSVIGDVKRMRSILKNPKSMQAVQYFLENNRVSYGKDNVLSTSVSSIIKTQDRCASVMSGIKNGLNEKSIINQVRDHYTAIHPTQKPVRLLERLLALVIPDKPKNEIMVADFFGGSFSTMEAVFNMGMNGIACEIDKEYFEAGKKRIENLQPNLFTSEL